MTTSADGTTGAADAAKDDAAAAAQTQDGAAGAAAGTGDSASATELKEKITDADQRTAQVREGQEVRDQRLAGQAHPEGEQRRYRLRVEIQADSPDKMAAMVKQVAARYGDPLQISETSGNFESRGDMADVRCLIEVAPAPAAAADDAALPVT